MTVCQYCDKKYRTKFALKRHLLSHAPWYSGDYLCSFCHIRFQDKTRLISHSQSVRHQRSLEAAQIFHFQATSIPALRNNFVEKRDGSPHFKDFQALQTARYVTTQDLPDRKVTETLLAATPEVSPSWVTELFPPAIPSNREGMEAILEAVTPIDVPPDQPFQAGECDITLSSMMATNGFPAGGIPLQVHQAEAGSPPRPTSSTGVGLKRLPSPPPLPAQTSAKRHKSAKTTSDSPVTTSQMEAQSSPKWTASSRRWLTQLRAKPLTLRGLSTSWRGRLSNRR